MSNKGRIRDAIYDALRGTKEPLPPPKHRHDPNRPYSQRLQRYEDTMAVIRDAITNSLSDERRKLVFGPYEKEIEYSTLDLLCFFIRDFQMEKYGKTDIHLLESGAPEPPQLRTMSKRELSWPSGRTDDSATIELFDEPDQDIVILQSQNIEMAERIRRIEKKAAKDREGRDNRIFDLEAKARHWESKYKDLRHENDIVHQEEINKLRADFNSRWYKRVQEGDRKHHEEIQAIEIEKEALQGRVQTLKAGFEIKDHELAIKEQEIMSRDDQIAKFTNNEAWYQREMRSKDKKLNDELARITAEHIEEAELKKDEYDASIRDLNGELGQKDRELEQKDREMREQKRQYDQDIDELKQKYDHDIDELKQHYESTIAGLVRDHKKEKADLVKTYKEKMTELAKANKEAIAAATAEMRQNIASKNAMLFEREGFAAILDRDLKSKFLALKFDVAHLARQAWTRKQLLWTPEVMQAVTTNADRTQEQLLRDRLWWILHDRVFCSPFRMFGEEGRTLEGEWIHSFKRDPEFRTGDFTWPTPSLNAERFRYRTVKECQTALREPASHLDPRARVKKGFKESREGLVKALTAAMGEATTTDQAITADIEQLIKKTVSIWLEFGIQRCRLMVTMPTDKIASEEDKVQLAREKQLELSSSPGLVRYGDDEGEDLGNKQTVSSCEEEKVLVS